jgi:hypothetical protein
MGFLLRLRSTLELLPGRYCGTKIFPLQRAEKKTCRRQGNCSMDFTIITAFPIKLSFPIFRKCQISSLESAVHSSGPEAVRCRNPKEFSPTN